MSGQAGASLKANYNDNMPFQLIASGGGQPTQIISWSQVGGLTTAPVATTTQASKAMRK